MDDSFNKLLEVLAKMGITQTQVDDKTKKAVLESVGLPTDVLNPKNVSFFDITDFDMRTITNSFSGILKESEQDDVTPEDVMRYYNFSKKDIKTLTYLNVTTNEAVLLSFAPKEINKIGLLIALRSCRYSKEQNSANGIEILIKYPSSVQPIIRNYLTGVIRKGEISKASDAAEIEILDKHGKWVQDGIISGNLAVACKNILADYPSNFIRFKGDLDLRKSIDKKSEFDDTFLNRVIVGGDFYASKYGKTLPMKVQGTVYFVRLDKGDAEKGEPSYITKDTVFPVTEKIDCSYSISGFDVFFTTNKKGNLVGTLPDSLKTLVVEPAFLRKDYICNNLTNVLDFAELYQDVVVMDTKGNILLNTLIEISKDIDNKKTQAQEEKTVKPAERKTTVINAEPKRLGTDWSVMDLRKAARSIPEKYGKDKFSDDELRNFIKEAMKYTNLTKKKVTDKGGNIVDIINISEMRTFFDNLDKVIEERQPKTDDNVDESKGDVIVLSFLSSSNLALQKMADLSHPAH